MAKCACGCGHDTPIATRNWHTLGIVKGQPRKYVAGHNRNRASLEDRFWARVDKTRDCWLWTGSRDHRGYGRLQRGERGKGVVKAHRLSYELRHGPIAEGLFVCHRCDNPQCVNPDHLFLGTNADNLADAKAKKRMPGRPLAVDAAALIAFMDAGGTYRTAAQHFDIPTSTVYRTLKRHGRLLRS